MPGIEWSIGQSRPRDPLRRLVDSYTARALLRTTFSAGMTVRNGTRNLLRVLIVDLAAFICMGFDAEDHIL